MLTKSELMAGARSLVASHGMCNHEGDVDAPTVHGGWRFYCKECSWEITSITDSDVVIRALILKALGHHPPAVGDWYRHTVGDRSADVKIVEIDHGRVFFHDHTSALLADVQDGGPSFVHIEPQGAE